MGWLVGCDVGGTFTDFYALETGSGRVVVHKTPSTPADPSEAILAGLRALAEAHGVAPGALDRLAHGTTVGTNALIQRSGGPVAVITTEGFRDLLEIGRQIRPRMFDLQRDYPPPLAPRHLRFEVRERLQWDGSERVPLDAESVAAAVEAVAASGADSCAVCFLFAHVNGAHEAAVGEALAARAPALHVSLSSAVQPEFREYERFSTTLLNAFLQPRLDRYMRNLGAAVATFAPHAHLGINQSSGGLMSAERAARFPIRTALSGPAAGAVGAAETARQAGRSNVVTLDMGGTSADVCLLRDGAVEVAFGREVAGFPVRLPMVDVNTVGAGGGSIAWIDRDGLMKVGPQSAGADPGPACYGRGGGEATVTDANLFLGRLSPAGLLGGTMAIDHDAAAASLGRLAERLGLTVERAALGVLEIVTATMVRAIRAVSIERGHDPRACVLMPFGGAGALHAGMVARALGIAEILVPARPGILCAEGLVASDLKEDLVRSRLLRTGDRAGLAEELAALRAEADAWFALEGIPDGRRRAAVGLDMRYVGQNFELRVALDGDAITGEAIPGEAEILARFHAEHERSYGYASPSDPVEIVNLRLTATGTLETVAPPRLAPAEGPAAAAGSRPAWFSGDGPVDTPVYDRARLAPGHRIAGPAIVEQLDATTVIHPGDRAEIDTHGNIIVAVGP